MKTIDDFRYSLNFRNMAGGSRSFEDLKALRDLLAEHAQRVASICGAGVIALRLQGAEHNAEALEVLRDEYAAMIEADVMAIDAYIEKRGK